MRETRNGPPEPETAKSSDGGPFSLLAGSVAQRDVWPGLGSLREARPGCALVRASRSRHGPDPQH